MDIGGKGEKQLEIERLKELLSFGILDTSPEKEFDDLAQLASIICDTPTALISFIDDSRQWYKAKVGMDLLQVPIEDTFCRHTIRQDTLLEIPDASQDDRVCTNSFVTKENGVRFYAGIALRTEKGLPIGTVCVIDHKPRLLDEPQKKALEILASHTINLLETRKKNTRLGRELENVLKKKIEETQELLNLKEAEYNKLFQAITRSNGVVEFSPEGFILSVNKNFSEMTGYHEQELVGKHHTVLLDQEDQAKNLLFWQSLKSGAFQSGRFKRLRKDGSVLYIQASYSPVLDSHEQVIRITKIAQDITMETHYRLALEKAKKMADDLNAQKDTFIANMSHEIRTPIHAIIGFTDLLLEKNLPEEFSSKLEAIKLAGDTLLYLVNDLLDLSKIEAGLLQIEHLPYRLEEAVRDVFGMLRLKAAQKGLQFDYHVGPNLPEMVVGDKNRLIQILINLLGNAIKFTHHGAVHLDLRNEPPTGEPSNLHFTISDTGIGISKEKLDLIFERFTQAEANTSRKYGGTGLGLNISRLLIEKQGGWIRVESEPGKGSRFEFSLPCKIYFNESFAAAPLRESDQPNKSSARILMCEDNELNQRLVQSLFRNTPYQLDLAVNGIEGLNLLASKAYDLVLMDIQMPEMDGYQAIRAIRTDLKSAVPVIALTAHSMVAEREKCLSLGMNDYLSKPFKKEALLAKIEFWLNHSKELKEPPVLEDGKEEPLISLEQLEAFSGGDSNFQKEMLLLFRNQSEKALRDMTTYLAGGDLVNLGAMAHKLKSSFGMVGADLLLLENLETLASRKPAPDEIVPVLGALENQLRQLHFEVEKILNNFKA